MGDKETNINRRASLSNTIMEPAVRMRNLVKISQEITVEARIPVTRYFNSGRELLKSANSLEEKGELDKAFLYYLRYSTLFLEKIIAHPGYATADPAEKQVIRTQCNIILGMAEKLKAKVMEMFEAEYKAHTEGKQPSANEGNVIPESSPTDDHHVIKGRSIESNPTNQPEQKQETDSSAIPPAGQLDLKAIDQKYNFSDVPPVKDTANLGSKSDTDTWEEELNQKLEELKKK